MNTRKQEEGLVLEQKRADLFKGVDEEDIIWISPEAVKSQALADIYL